MPSAETLPNVFYTLVLASMLCGPSATQTVSGSIDSFYTTKPSGMGMGLSISRSILQAHGGRLWATAKAGPGTIFDSTLPKYHEEESNAAV